MIRVSLHVFSIRMNEGKSAYGFLLDCNQIYPAFLFHSSCDLIPAILPCNFSHITR